MGAFHEAKAVLMEEDECRSIESEVAAWQEEL